MGGSGAWLYVVSVRLCLGGVWGAQAPPPPFLAFPAGSITGLCTFPLALASGHSHKIPTVKV